MANKGYSEERGLQIVVALTRVPHNVACFINDGGRKLPRTYLARIQTQIAYVQPRKTPGIKRGCRSNARCQKHNCVSTHLFRQWVNWFPYTLSPQIQKLKKTAPRHPQAICRDVPISAHYPDWQDKNTKVGGARWHARPIHQSFTPMHGLLT